MPTDFVTRLPAFLRGRVGIAFFSAAGLALSLTAACLLHRMDEGARRLEFERRQNLRHTVLVNSLNDYEHSLFALRLVTENNQALTPDEFKRAAQDILSRSSGIECVQWVPLIRSENLGSFAARMRDLISPSYQARYRQGLGPLLPLDSPGVTGREEHAILTYLYPFEGNELLLGYDIFTGPSAPSLDRARQTLEITLTPSFHLAQGFDSVILLCYARRDARPDAAPESGPGYLQLVLNLHSVVQRIWNLNQAGAADFALYDLTDEGPQPLYTQLTNRGVSETIPHDFDRFHGPGTLCRDIRIGGRTWQACYRPGAVWESAANYTGPGLVLIAGALLTLLGVGYLRLLLLRTERIRREVEKRTLELSESRLFLDTIIRHSPSSIWVKDADLRFRLVNAEFCRTYAVPMEEVIGRSDALVLAPEAVVETERVDREILADGQTRHFEFSCVIRDRLRTYLVAKFPLRDPSGAVNAVAGVATEITELRLAEAERATMERRLLETQKTESLGVLAGGIAHDFNNLLTSVLGHASLCRARLTPGDAQQTSLAQIEHSARRAAELCQQMLAYAGQGRNAVQAVELGALIRDSLSLLRLSVSKRARLHFDLAPDLPAVEGDLTQLRQVVINLVANASESFGEGEGDITLSTWRVVADAKLWSACVNSPDLPAGDYVCLEVSDTGCGIPDENPGRLFEPFFTTKFAGRGLGLAAVLGIVRNHGGAVRAGLRSGGGSIFSIYLPIVDSVVTSAPAAQSAAPSEATPPPQSTNPPSTRTVRLLLVDDEAPVRDTAAALLRACGYEVETANDGAAALERLRQGPRDFHAAILDLTMPGLCGPELLAACRELNPDLPVLLVSGYSATAAGDMLVAPRTAFLAKPFVLLSLREKLCALLDDV
jgi:PAS domain S-box-containing protein